MIVKAKKLCFIIFILVFLQTTLCYKYNFSQFSGSSVCNQDNVACTPQFSSGYNGSGTGIMKLRQGVMILPGSVVSSNSGMNQGSTGTLCFTVFIFNVNQLSTLYTVTSTSSKNSYLAFMINNGKMRIESGTYSGGYVASPTKETSSSSMYSTGWNLICYTLSNTNFNFYSYPRFTTSVVSESATNTTFETSNVLIGVFGGLMNSAGTSFSNSFQGIIHTIDIQSTTYTSTSIASSFLVPTSSPFTICDYYIGMFTNLSVQDAFNAFTNLMYNHYSQTQQFTNSLSSTVDTNGLAFSNGQTQTITNVKVTSQRAIGVQLWVMGEFTNNVQIASIAKDSSNKGAYVSRSANNIIVGTTYSGTTITFSNAVTSLSNSGWILIGFSIGWMGTNNDFMLCGYIYQPFSTYESGDCAASISISTTDFGSGVTLYIELGSGISGYVREVYIANHLEHSHILQLFKNSFGVKRYDCYEEFNYDPHYIRQGCGNGHILSTESSEQCDDGNTSSSDGCSSSCTIENLYRCVNTVGLSPVTTCTFTCRNANYESQYAEGCDDGNTSSNDGCSSLCAVETGWTCTNVAGSKSTCSTICGDGKRLGAEACDDGNISDNQGCKSDCTGSINGWHCSGGSSTTADTCTQQCNDGYITVSEQCEDGNTSNLDGCSSTCQTEAGWTCTNNAGMTSTTCVSICGDGKRLGAEACDDGNISDNQGCKSDCTGSINGWHCSGGSFTTADICTEQCNDGFITASEQCEDGNQSNLDGCSSTCQIESGWTCTNNAGLTSSSCTSICGDGKRLGVEVCDDGNIFDNQGCKSDCTSMINGWYCSGGTAITADTCTEQCNDGYITVSEQCEDGNVNSGDGCSSSCQTETGWTCTNKIGMILSVCNPTCGDGRRIGNENCDDGNKADNKGCKSDCSGQMNGWYCSGGSISTADICTEQCNDRYITSNEQCEDGNISDGDGCSSNCQIEVGWTCTNNYEMTSSTCNPICGDGKRLSNEACDDGDSSDNKGCKPDCSGSMEGWNCSGGNSSTADICKSNSTDLQTSTSTSIVTNSVLGAACATMIFSFCNLSTPQGLWITMNQFQLILLLLLTNSHIPKSIIDYLSGLKATTWSMNFIPFKDIPCFKSIVNLLNYELENKTLGYLGVFSGSTFVNNFSLICVFVIIMLTHLSFCVIKYIFRKCIQKRQKLSDFTNKIHQFLMLSIYIRLIFQANQFFMLCSFSEIKAWNTSSTSRIISLCTAFICAIICNAFILLSLFYWIRNRNIEKSEENSLFREFFNNIKDKSKPRFYSTVSLLRRELFVVFLIMANSLNSIWIIAPMIVVQAFYLASLIYIRPYKPIKDNLLEITNEFYYFVLVAFLSHFNSDSKWISVAENAYFCIIIANSFTIFVITITSIIFQIIIKIKQKCKRNKIDEDKSVHDVATHENKTYVFRDFRFVEVGRSSKEVNKSNLSHATSDIQLNDLKYSFTKQSNSHPIDKREKKSNNPQEESKIAQYWNNYYQERKPKILNK